MPFLDDFQRKGERGSETMISENRSDLNFTIFRRDAAVAGHGLSWGLKESRFMGSHEAASEVQDSRYMAIACP